MAEQDSGISGVAWFLVGAAVGAAAALLYAPQSGKSTRAYLKWKAEEGRDALQDSAGEAVQKGRELYTKGREMADEVADVFERGRKLVQG